MRSQAHRRPFDLMDAIAILCFVAGAAIVAGAFWLGLVWFLSLAQYVPSSLR